MYEVAYLREGELVRGGIKAPLLTVGKWIRDNAANDPDTVYVAVPASPEAVTEAELYAQLDAKVEAQLDS